MVDEPTHASYVKDLDTLYRVGRVGLLSDGQLLDRFLSEGHAGAEWAFTALVERHGPMVLRTCRQWLGDPHDAQDAFQATFLVLVRKARSVRQRESLASWLHGVARRVSHRARAQALRRREHELRCGATHAQTAVLEARGSGDDWPELHEEIQHLPERFREPVVLCYLEGLTTEAASLRLGCAQGTVMSRLARARVRLRRQLTRRGLSVPALLTTAGLDLPAEAATAALPAALVESTVRAALAFTTTHASATTTAALTSASAVLARGVLHAMMISKLKVLGAAILVGGLALGSVPTVARQLVAAKGQGKGVRAVAAGPTAARAGNLQADVDELTRRNAALEIELRAIRAELKALANASARPAKVQPPRPRPEPMMDMMAMPGMAMMPGMSPGMMSGMMPEMGNPIPPEILDTVKSFGGKNDQPLYQRAGRYFFVTSARGDRFTIYDIQANRASSIPLPASDDQRPTKVLPVFGDGPPGDPWTKVGDSPLLVLHLTGVSLKQVNVFDLRDWKWYPLKLRAEVSGTVAPSVSVQVAYHVEGRFLHAFSAATHRWETLTLPEGVEATPSMSKDAVWVSHDGILDLFQANTGTWQQIDFRALVESAIKQEQAEAGPEMTPFHR